MNLASKLTVVICALAGLATAQSDQRVFPQSRAAIEQCLKTLQPALSGRVPILEGFAQPAEHPLDRYQRGFYQATVEVTANPDGGSIVHIHAKVTAWYADLVAAKSGYKLLNSNGRIESDLLDQLAEQLAKAAPEKRISAESTSAGGASPSIKFPTNSFSVADAARASREPAAVDTSPNANQSLADEAKSLEEILRSQAHPTNLIAVRKSGTPVVESPSLTAKPLFLASQHDEFEMLDFTANWVHVRVSGLSRGWIWRSSVEMPNGIADSPASASEPQPASADLFRISREETAPFPGDWASLREKNVKIISVQNAGDPGRPPAPADRLEFSKFLFEKYADSAKSLPSTAGIVLIFDSADGGMIAATSAAIAEWHAGRVTDTAFWRVCYFDPPELIDPESSASARR